MKNRRLHIDEVVSILRMKYESKRSNVEISKLLSISKTTVNNYVRRSVNANICVWPLTEVIDNFELEKRIFPETDNGRKSKINQFDYKDILAIMKEKGATLKQLHAEIFEINNQFVSYSQFCREYRRYKKSIKANRKNMNTYAS